jgi:hypothetical protein
VFERARALVLLCVCALVLCPRVRCFFAFVVVMLRVGCFEYFRKQFA